MSFLTIRAQPGDFVWYQTGRWEMPRKHIRSQVVEIVLAKHMVLYRTADGHSIVDEDVIAFVAQGPDMVGVVRGQDK